MSDSVEKIEFALRQVAVSIEYLLDVVQNDPYAYDVIPSSLHHAVVDLMKEVSAVDWEVLA